MSQEKSCAQPGAVPLVVKTAPARIWLQVSDDREHNDKPFPASTHGDEVTWCQDKVLDCEVEYIRADLASGLLEALIDCRRALQLAKALGELAVVDDTIAKATGAQA